MIEGIAGMMEITRESDQNPIESLTSSELEGFITYRIVRLHAALDRQAVETLKRTSGMRQNEWKIISLLGLGRARNSTDIARVTGMDPAIISRTLRSLEKDGLLLTERSEEDRRVVNLALSDRGRARFEATFPHMLARQRTLLSALTTEEREIAWKILDKLETVSEVREFNL